MKISRKKIVLYQLIEILGLVLAMVFGFLAAVVSTWWGYVLFFTFLGSSIAGNLLRDRIFRCPHCGHLLLKRQYFRPFAGEDLFEHCPGCGWRVTIEEE